MVETMPQSQMELEYEWYKPGFGLKYIMGFEDPKLEEFLDDIAGFLLYKSYNEVYLPEPLIKKLKGKIKRVFWKDDKVCAELVNGDVYCAGLGEGVEGYYYEMTEDEMEELEKEGDEIAKQAEEETLKAMKEGRDEWYGWIVSSNPDGYAVYEIVIWKE